MFAQLTIGYVAGQPDFDNRDARRFNFVNLRVFVHFLGQVIDAIHCITNVPLDGFRIVVILIKLNVNPR